MKKNNLCNLYKFLENSKNGHWEENKQKNEEKIFFDPVVC